MISIPNWRKIQNCSQFHQPNLASILCIRCPTWKTGRAAWAKLSLRIWLQFRIFIQLGIENIIWPRLNSMAPVLCWRCSYWFFPPSPRARTLGNLPKSSEIFEIVKKVYLRIIKNKALKLSVVERIVNICYCFEKKCQQFSQLVTTESLRAPSLGILFWHFQKF